MFWQNVQIPCGCPDRDYFGPFFSVFPVQWGPCRLYRIPLTLSAHSSQSEVSVNSLVLVKTDPGLALCKSDLTPVGPGGGGGQGGGGGR